MPRFFWLFQAGPESFIETEYRTTSLHRTMIVYAVIGIVAAAALARWNIFDRQVRDCRAFTIGESLIGGCDPIGG